MHKLPYFRPRTEILGEFQVNHGENTGVMGQWLERLPRKRKVVGSSPDRVIPKTFKNGTHCPLVWRSISEKGVGKFNTRSYQWIAELQKRR